MPLFSNPIAAISCLAGLLPVRCRSLAGQGDGDTFAQVVWQVICVVVQFMVHEVLAVELAPVIVDVVVPLDELDGTKQPLWQVAACELQNIMQFVSVELCAVEFLT